MQLFCSKFSCMETFEYLDRPTQLISHPDAQKSAKARKDNGRSRKETRAPKHRNETSYRGTYKKADPDKRFCHNFEHTVNYEIPQVPAYRLRILAQ